jgi:hypothetical protein
VRSCEGDQVEERAARIRELRAEIDQQSQVVARLPEGHAARDMYLDQIEDKAAELAHLEHGQTFGIYLRACGLVSLGALVASSGVVTGIALGAFCGAVALGMVVIHNLDR